MTIELNNRKEDLNVESLTIEDIIKIKTFTFKMLVTKLNGQVVMKEERGKTLVRDGDILTVLHLISGG